MPEKIGQPQRIVVVGVDGSVSSEHALYWAAEFAGKIQARSHVVLARRHPHRVVQDDALFLPVPIVDDASEAERERATKQLDYYVTKSLPADAAANVTVEFAEGDPAGSLIRIAEHLGAEASCWDVEVAAGLPACCSVRSVISVRCTRAAL